MRKTAIVGLAVLLLLALAPLATAGSSMPTGTIDLNQPARFAAGETDYPRYGDEVSFSTSVDGRVPSRASVYVRVLCWQGSEVVYQWSSAPSFTFPLTDQAGQGLEWNGDDADCTGELMYYEPKGKGAIIETIDTTIFHAWAKP